MALIKLSYRPSMEGLLMIELIYSLCLLIVALIGAIAGYCAVQGLRGS